MLAWHGRHGGGVSDDNGAGAVKIAQMVMVVAAVVVVVVVVVALLMADTYLELLCIWREGQAHRHLIVMQEATRTHPHENA